MVHPIIQSPKYGSVARRMMLGRSGRLSTALTRASAQYGRFREGPGYFREGPGTEYKISSVEILASMLVGSPQREVHAPFELIASDDLWRPRLVSNGGLPDCPSSGAPCRPNCHGLPLIAPPHQAPHVAPIDMDCH